MSAHISAHGRLARDPEQRTTKTGKLMVLASIACDVTPGNATDQETMWLSLMAFGDQAEALARCQKGESVSVMGKLTRSRYVTQTGEERESFSVLVDGLVTARSSRPNQRSRTQAPRPGPREHAHDFDDEIAF